MPISSWLWSGGVWPCSGMATSLFEEPGDGRIFELPRYHYLVPIAAESVGLPLQLFRPSIQNGSFVSDKYRPPTMSSLIQKYSNIVVRRLL